MSEEKTLYKQILKATSLFGGIQILTILISIIRSKIIAVLIGPTGMGISGLLNSTIGFVSSLTSAGLETSAVKFISQKNGEKNEAQVEKIIAVVKKTIWLTGILGSLLMLISSYWLGKITFGSTDYTIAFVWLSATLLFKQLTNGHLAILQGLQKLNYLAKANLYGSIFGLIISVPFYYYFRLDAIVISIIVSSLSALVFAMFFSNKVAVKKVNVTFEQAKKEGKEMLQLGLMLSLTGLMVTAVTYILQIYISKSGVSQTGLYTAGITLLNSYVGIIFTAMSADYFPRLSAVNQDNEKVRVIVLQQAMIAILLITPIIVIFIAFSPLIIKILFTEKFISIVPMVNFGIIGMLFKAVSWSMGYILIAKGDSKMFIKTSIGFNSLFLGLMVFGYYLDGLSGIGIAFLIYYFLHFFLLKAITFYRYGFHFDKKFLKIFSICIFLSALTILATYVETKMIRFTLLAFLVIFTSIFSLFQLNKKVGILPTLNNFKK